MKIAFEAADLLVENWIELERKVLYRCPQELEFNGLGITRIDGSLRLTYHGRNIRECSLKDKIEAVELVPKFLDCVTLKIQSMNNELSIALNKLRRYVHDAE